MTYEARKTCGLSAVFFAAFAIFHKKRRKLAALLKRCERLP